MSVGLSVNQSISLLMSAHYRSGILSVVCCDLLAAAVCGQSHTLRKHPVELCVPASEPSGGPCLLVSGIPSSVSQEELEMYFESKKKSGGGEVTELVCNNVDGTAAIVFESRNSKVAVK